VASYPAVIELRVDGITQVTRVLDTIAKLDNALVSIKKTPLAIDSGKATDGIRVLKKEVDSFVISLGNGTKQLATTTAGLNSQAAAFRNLAANAKIGGQAFKLYTQAAEQARQKSSLTGGLAEIEAQAQLYKVGKTAPTQAFKGVDELVKFGSQIPKNTASLQLYKAELERVLTVIEFGTQDYRNLERAIAAVNKQMDIGQGMGSQFGPAAPGKAKSKSAAITGIGATLGKRLPGAISGGIIGGSFPLLFGQGGGAAVGGLVGGVAGGLLGPGGSFAGSLFGTLIGDIASQGQKIKQLGTDIGFSAQQANVLADGFKKANTDIEKFTGVVQNIRGLGLELESQAELIKLTTTLTEKYGGQFDKVGNAITSALESGKVSQATFNQLTSQGINIQQALADKLGVSKDRLLEMAKEGKIDIQDLIDVLVDMGNKGVQATKKPTSGMEQLGKAVQGLGTAIGDLGAAIMKALKPALDWLGGAIAGIIDLATRAVNAIANMLSGGTAETALANAKARQRLAVEGGPSTGTRYLTPKQQERLNILQREEQAKIIKPDTKVKPIDVSSLGRAPKGGGKTAKPEGQSALESSVRRTRALETEASTLLLTATIQEKINDAERIGADQLAARLTFERDRAKILGEYAARQEKVANTANKQEEILALRKKRNAELVGLQLTYEKNLVDLDLRRLAPGYAKQTQLQQEAFILQETLVGRGEEARLQVEIANAVKDMDAAQSQAVATQMRKNFELQKQLDIAMQMKQLYTDIGMTIKDGVVGAIQGAIDGTKSLQEVATNLLNNIANKLLDVAINMALFGALSGTGTGGGLLGGLIPRAKGGSVSTGSSYMVGERGPELFVPGRSGTIVPNDALGSGGSTSVVVNVDASGSNVQGDGAQAGQLGKAIGIAVQQELIKQKRPGGLLAGV